MREATTLIDRAAAAACTACDHGVHTPLSGWPRPCPYCQRQHYPGPAPAPQQVCAGCQSPEAPEQGGVTRRLYCVTCGQPWVPALPAGGAREETTPEGGAPCRN